MAYDIRRGETGFDILMDGGTKIHSIGYGTREVARAIIRELEKTEQALLEARLALRRLCYGIEEDGLARETLASMLAQERDYWLKS